MPGGSRVFIYERRDSAGIKIHCTSRALSLRLSRFFRAVFVRFSISVIILHGILKFAFRHVSIGNTRLSKGMRGITCSVSNMTMPVRSR